MDNQNVTYKAPQVLQEFVGPLFRELERNLDNSSGQSDELTPITLVEPLARR